MSDVIHVRQGLARLEGASQVLHYDDGVAA